MLWGCFCAHGLVSQKPGAFLSQSGARLPPGTMGGTARPGSVHDPGKGALAEKLGWGIWAETWRPPTPHQMQTQL